MANILIVHAHHEPQSFSSALARTAGETFIAEGHAVVYSHLNALGFNPVSDRRNFTTVANAQFLKQQEEEGYATKNNGFAPDVEAEMQKVEKCDLLIFSFPLWWFGLPAILKGWVDRVFAYGRFYGRGKWCENGSGRGKRAMVLMTTGGGEIMYGRNGMHPPISQVLTPIHRGIFWFNGFSPVPPFIAWSAAHGTDLQRQETLEKLRQRLVNIFQEPPLCLPLAADFDPQTFVDTVPRFMVTASSDLPFSEESLPRFPVLLKRLATLQGEGKLLDYHLSAPTSPNWRGFLLFRERTEAAVREKCQTLPLAAQLKFEVAPVDS